MTWRGTHCCKKSLETQTAQPIYCTVRVAAFEVDYKQLIYLAWLHL